MLKRLLLTVVLLCPLPLSYTVGDLMKDKLLQQLKRDEGFVDHAYQDHLGYWTIGIGRLIDRRKGGKITEDEPLYLLNNDVERFEKEVTKALPWVSNLDEARRGVILNMAFNLGTQGLLGFKNTLKNIQEGNYAQAAKMMLDSKWAYQVGNRAIRLAKQMETGQWQ